MGDAENHVAGRTIAAIASPPGRGGVGVVRVSGPLAQAIGLTVSGRGDLQPRYCHFATFRDSRGEPLDQGLVVFFPGPRSFTGEDVVELHGHGGPAVLNGILQAAFDAGAEAAEAGEFTRRAFLNDRMDLSQAEAVAELIEADSLAGARAALRSLEGEFGRQVEQLAEELADLRVFVEGSLDFPDEDVDFLATGDVDGRLSAVRERLTRLRERASTGVRLSEGFLVVLAGRPNAGKSSLLNCLAGRESAIVTERAGTTRDILREKVALDGFHVELADTAGLRETDDPVEREGVRRARDLVERADLVFFLVDSQQGWTSEDAREWGRLPEDRRVALWTKADLDAAEGAPAISCTGEPGVGPLEEELRRRLPLQGGGDALGARQRHLEVLDRVATELASAAGTLQNYGSGDLVAQDLRRAHEALGEITGRVHSDDLLGRIFATFCIGK
ncbi:tRNA uridine-5-carboxymethylaminomethyl(34) synthesis GTPase MnmE [Thiohalorhabdus denitrificans]|uniref:tRNA uridine-5-carboxymethylaminomethyl(34) synthesis GTPase MnmE n=1 Tax=Thiohalorhabdus denitrificans TaxID=381306 RepID=UPI001E2D244A|nr:tRNA uridine-5-carboxymethylaminomethyl(34) synthesis GTPase MnmE [Thiohalorhabdus denitrificans]